MFLVTLVLVSVVSHWYFAGWVTRSFPKLRPRRVRIVALVLAILPILLRLLTHFTWHWLVTDVMGASMTELLTVIAGSLVIFTFTILRRIAGRFAKRATPAPAPSETPTETPTLTRRAAIERGVGLATYGSMGSLLGWGLVRGRHAFELEELVVKIPGLPKALDGYTIAQVSDIHTGAFVTERELKEGFDLVRRAKPDLIVATGDLVDFYAGWAPLFARMLSDLPARDGRYAILGNHDYYADVSQVMKALGAARIELLLNRGTTIRASDGGGFALLGVDDLWSPKAGGPGPDLDKALRDVPPDLARVLLAHQPKYIEEAAGKVALQLSGHTHGGQINPGFSPASVIMKYVVGRYEVGGTSLYVNRGFGVAGPPSRIRGSRRGSCRPLRIVPRRIS